ncbi:MAG: MBL fold metallo-hydrolase [Trueperella sp.]|nr:MBL fold metallo-hydrolase [Trueperella sp.]
MIFLRNDQTYLNANTYVIADPDKKSALVVDPGAGAHAWVPTALSSRGLTLGAVLLTHGHADHVWDAAAVAGSAPVYLAQPDFYRMEDPVFAADATAKLALGRMGSSPQWSKPQNLVPLSDILTTTVEIVPGVYLRGIPAPGHTEGSTVFLFEGQITPDPEAAMAPTNRETELFLLAGDVIFNNGIGRTDLAGGDPYVMAATLRLLVQSLKSETYIFPGHGPHTTMFQELRYSQFLQHAMRN